MIVASTILVKTERGRQALAQRTPGLTPRQRALLISINGELDVAQLRERFPVGSPDEPDATIEKLLEAGLIEPMGGAAAPVVNGSSHDAEAPPRPLPARAVAPRPASPGKVVVGDWRRIQERAAELLRQFMGADADLLAMRLERARTEQDFLDNLERSFQVVENARGASALAQYRAGLIAR